MNIKLFSVCYKEEHFSEVGPPFEPWDNLENNNPKLREFPIFEAVFNSPQIKNVDYWGVLSPKFEKKAYISGTQFLDWINTSYQKKPHDVYFINPAPIVEAIFPSVNQHGDNCHPGLMDLIKRNIKELQNINLLTMHMDVNTFAMCNYFIGNKKFWNKYISFVNTFLSSVHQNPNDYNMLFNKSANYGPDTSLPYYTFAIERLFSIFLNIQLHKKEITFTHFHYTPQLIKDKTSLPNDIVEELIILSDIKQVAISGGYIQMMKHWAFLRNKFVQQNPYLFYLE